MLEADADSDSLFSVPVSRDSSFSSRIPNPISKESISDFNKNNPNKNRLDKYFEGLNKEERRELKDKVRDEAYAFTDSLYSIIIDIARGQGKQIIDYPERWLLPEDQTDVDETLMASLTTNLVIAYTNYINVVYYLSFDYLVHTKYSIVKSFLMRGDEHRPPYKSKFDISLDEQKEVVIQGIFHIINNENKKKLQVEVTEECITITGLSADNEAEKFRETFEEELKNNDVFKNKTFTFTDRLFPKFIKQSNIQKADVVLPKEIWKEIEINVINVFLKNKQYVKKNIPTKRGIILEGPPGNGKSLLVKYIENALADKVTFIYVTDALVANPNSLSKIFDIARRYTPCVLILEDVDSIGASREYGSPSFITAELLSRLDGLEELVDFVTIATTNFPEKIDDALKNRPNRFDRRIKIKLPSPERCAELLKISLNHRGVLNIKNEEVKQISEKLNGFSGAQIKEVIITAQMIALYENREVEYKDLIQSVEFLKENYYDDKNIGVGDTSKKKVGFRG